LAVKLALEWVEQGRVPDAVVRAGIRSLLRRRLAQLEEGGPEAMAARTAAFVASMGQSPVALVPELANAQHYEVPEEFFGLVLGPHRKYSGCYYAPGARGLGDAEEAALALTCQHAQLEDGQQVLELGCGWGSLSLWMAKHYPRSQVTAVSNSHSQRQYIERQAAERGLANLRIVTCDMNAFEAGRQYDRIVSVEMFEHMRNWQELFRRVAGWLAPGGRFFMHVFVHRSVPYAFEDQGDDDWMSRHFFSGGMMPSDELPALLQDDLRLEARWRWDGTHYERTANDWLANMDARRAAVWPVLERCYGAADAQRWWSRWRVFFMACAELWGYEGGRHWWVSHYRFGRRADARA
jgi:cyclopropane-fatty-acyl-phospholipid synthase